MAFNVLNVIVHNPRQTPIAISYPLLDISFENLKVCSPPPLNEGLDIHFGQHSLSQCHTYRK
jgi:hypothetical protein